jgi:transposase-like protein
VSKRRIFSVEYKKEIIKLVTAQGKKSSEVAKDIGVGVFRCYKKSRNVLLTDYPIH